MPIKIVKELLTGRDNQTHDIARWSWMITTVVIIIGASYNAFYTNSFGVREFAESIGIIAGAHGAAVFMKKDSEPTTVPLEQNTVENKK